MASYSRFFGGPVGDVPEYTQPQFAEVLEKIFSNGVFTDVDNELAVSENDPVSLSAVVASGEGWINGFWYQNTADLVKTLGAADPTNPRIDRIVLRLDTVTNFKISIEVLAGTPAASPSAPTLTQDASTWEISLAQVAVAASATSVSDVNITDEREYAIAKHGPLKLEYERDAAFMAKTVSVAADRYKILFPNRMFIYFNSKQFYLSSQATLDLSLEATWDSVATDYRVAATRAGLDFYIYACNTATRTPDILVSVNSSAPTGYNTTTSKKIGGFHCLCVAVGAIGGHTLTGYLAGDVLPQSVWDLKHMPISDPEGMVYDSGTGKWVDIYLASVSGSALVSINGGTIADGASAVKFHWYKFVQWLGRQKKKLPDQAEFMALSYGANQGTNITGDANPATTTGHTDSVGRRMISNIGCEDTCGVLQQWGRDRGGGQSAAELVNAYDVNDDAGSLGQHYLAPNCVRFGGYWADGVACGSRCSSWNRGPLSLFSNDGARGLSENRGD